jgi:hypothetical protein
LLKSTIKNITLVCSSLLTALIISQTANAQQRGLNVGAPVKIPPGQESQLLQFQLQNDKAGLRRMRVIPECVVGFGLSCNKTGGVVQKIIESNGGPTYQQMLMRAAGGDDNYRRFAGFYNNNPNLPLVPYSSFWRDSSPLVLDSNKYTLGGTVSRRPVSGLGAVTQNFAWSPLKGENLRDGLLNFKYAFGRVFLEEAAKIPDLNQKIIDLQLDQKMTDFYLGNLSSGLRALQTGNEAALKRSILVIMSSPYAPNAQNDGWANRTEVQVPDGLMQPGETATPPPDILTGLPSELFPNEVEIAQIDGDEGFIVEPQGGVGFPPELLAVALPFIFFLLFGGDNNSSNSSVDAFFPEITPTPIPTPTPTPPLLDNECPPGTINIGSGNVGEVKCDFQNPPPDTKTVVEPSALKAIILLTLIFCLVNYKKRHRHRLT